jgi:DtxR family Mn-dependent transcriptional regulator
MTDLIDTTEMYLRTVYELDEEGVVPLRARIAERLGHSGPTVSETVARLERAGLLTVRDDRHLELTPAGRERATRVMRKHRLAECLLTDVIGLPWEQVHIEACRWEHVMSADVERRLIHVLGDPMLSPYGSPIPLRAEVGGSPETPGFLDGAIPLPDAFASDAAASNAPASPPARAGSGEGPGEPVFRLVRLGESIQNHPQAMSALAGAGTLPGVDVVARRGDGGWELAAAAGGEPAALTDRQARSVFVTPA